MTSMVKILTERVPYLYACCDALLTAEDIASSMRFQHEPRRMEHLTWRRVVRRELGRNVAISYNEVGAPVVNVPNTHISVSHGAGMVAVAIADCPVGIDIESLERNFERVAERYMSTEERGLSDDCHWPAMVWCSKEAMYKLFGRRGVELSQELKIESYNSEQQWIVGTLRDATNKTLCLARATIEIQIIEEETIVAVATINDSK